LSDPGRVRALMRVTRRINETVYDVSKFVDEHPGGASTLAGAGGQDATKLFMDNHDPAILESVAANYRIGNLGERI
jgi:cytochrome b involved in lipid metabolism